MFQSFNSMFAVIQQNKNGTQPFTVEVFTSDITGARGGVAFSNIGGQLTLQDVNVDSATLTSLVSTGSSSITEGATFLRRIAVVGSDIMVREASKFVNA